MAAVQSEATRSQGETAAGKGTSQPTPLFNLRSPETRQNGMCVGIDSARKGSIQAMHTTCTKTGIWGYSFVQTTPPPAPDLVSPACPAFDANKPPGAPEFRRPVNPAAVLTCAETDKNH